MSEYIDIGTEGLAQSLGHVTRAVGSVSDSVNVAANALCQAEREASDRVCQNVTHGFFTFMHTQLLQNKVKVQSQAESCLLSLRHFAQSLAKTQAQLQADFQRISLRYTRVFEGLNQALQSRIYALDKPVAEVADTDYAALDRRVLNAGAPSVVVQQDAVSLTSELATVRCKRNCARVVEAVKTLILHGARLAKTIESISQDIPQSEPKSVSVPVLAVETTDLYVEGNSQLDFLISPENPNSAVTSKIRDFCYGDITRFSWTDGDSSHKEEVARRIKRLMSDEKIDDRRKTLILAMLGRSKWQELEAGE